MSLCARSIATTRRIGFLNGTARSTSGDSEPECIAASMDWMLAALESIVECVDLSERLSWSVRPGREDDTEPRADVAEASATVRALASEGSAVMFASSFEGRCRMKLVSSRTDWPIPLASRAVCVGRDRVGTAGVVAASSSDVSAAFDGWRYEIRLTKVLRLRNDESDFCAGLSGFFEFSVSML
jgi:hypothetical protein